MTFLVTWVASLLLIAAPFPAFMAIALPQWGLLFVVWWSLMRNYQLSITLLTFSSLPIDVLYGTALGMHAFIFALLAYVLTLLGPRVRQVNLVMQSVVVFFVLLVASAVSYWARTLTGLDPKFYILFTQTLASAIFWAPMRYLFERISNFTGEAGADSS